MKTTMPILGLIIFSLCLFSFTARSGPELSEPVTPEELMEAATLARSYPTESAPFQADIDGAKLTTGKYALLKAAVQPAIDKQAAEERIRDRQNKPVTYWFIHSGPWILSLAAAIYLGSLWCTRK